MAKASIGNLMDKGRKSLFQSAGFGCGRFRTLLIISAAISGGGSIS
jgi:hypothetical protein